MFQLVHDIPIMIYLTIYLFLNAYLVHNIELKT